VGVRVSPGPPYLFSKNSVFLKMFLQGLDGDVFEIVI
jgi:hypothetical protein